MTTTELYLPLPAETLVRIAVSKLKESRLKKNGKSRQVLSAINYLQVVLNEYGQFPTKTKRT